MLVYEQQLFIEGMAFSHLLLRNIHYSIDTGFFLIDENMVFYTPCLKKNSEIDIITGIFHEIYNKEVFMITH